MTDYDRNVLQPLKDMSSSSALTFTDTQAVHKLLKRALRRPRTAAQAATSGGTRAVPVNKVASLYVVSNSLPLTRGSPFHKVSNFEYAWPLRVTIPLGYGIDLIECGWPGHLQGFQVRPFCEGARAVELRKQVMHRLEQLATTARAKPLVSSGDAEPLLTMPDQLRLQPDLAPPDSSNDEPLDSATGLPKKWLTELGSGLEVHDLLRDGNCIPSVCADTSLPSHSLNPPGLAKGGDLMLLQPCNRLLLLLAHTASWRPGAMKLLHKTVGDRPLTWLPSVLRMFTSASGDPPGELPPHFVALRAVLRRHIAGTEEYAQEGVQLPLGFLHAALEESGFCVCLLVVGNRAASKLCAAIHQLGGAGPCISDVVVVYDRASQHVSLLRQRGASLATNLAKTCASHMAGDDADVAEQVWELLAGGDDKRSLELSYEVIQV